jgi:hypothetical protein
MAVVYFSQVRHDVFHHITTTDLPTASPPNFITEKLPAARGELKTLEQDGIIRRPIRPWF